MMQLLRELLLQSDIRPGHRLWLRAILSLLRFGYLLGGQGVWEPPASNSCNFTGCASIQNEVETSNYKPG